MYQEVNLDISGSNIFFQERAVTKNLDELIAYVSRISAVNDRDSFYIIEFQLISTLSRLYGTIDLPKENFLRFLNGYIHKQPQKLVDEIAISLYTRDNPKFVVGIIPILKRN